MLKYGEVFVIGSGNLFCKVVFYVILFLWIDGEEDKKKFKC